MAKVTRALCLALALLGSPALHAGDSKPGEYQVKAAYLYNFGRFVVWPSPVKGEPFTVCVLGHDPFGVVLDATLSGETINGLKVVAKRIMALQESGSCQILFISASDLSQPRLKEILAELDQRSVLTVSDSPEFAQRGGMVQFVLDGNRVRFEVNLAAAERARLSLSSQLLRLATSVRRSP